MRVRLLGPVEVVVDGIWRPVRGIRRTGLLAVLASRSGEVVESGYLTAAVWGEDSSPAANTLQSHLSYLRRTFGLEIEARPPGYVLDLGVDGTDLLVAERLVQQASAEAAALALRTALDRHRESAHRVGQSTALLYLGATLRRAGDLPGAAAALQDALALDRDIGNRSGEVMVLNEMGAVYRLVGDVERAVATHQEAFDLAGLVSSPWDKAQSLAGFGRCAIARGRRQEGTAQLRQALEIFRQINAAEATELAPEIASLS